MNIEESIEILESYKESLEEYEDNPRIIQAIETLLTAYENSQLEIEELKSRNQGKTEALKEWINGERVSIHCVHKNKIKEMIKELEKLNDEATGIGFGFAIYYLQSLLKEEGNKND